MPVAITIILSFISGIVVSTKVDGIEIQGKNVSKKIDPPSGNVDKIKDAGIITKGGSSSKYPLPGDENFIGPLTDAENHLIYGEGIGPKKRGVLGAHNQECFYKTLKNTGFDLSDLFVGERIEHPTINGIYSQRYQVPSKDGRLNFIGFKIADSPKTYYDPNIISNSQMIQWGNEAMRNGRIRSNGSIVGRASNGLEFVGNIQLDGSIRFYPTLN